MRKDINMDDKNIVEKGFTLIELLVVVVILGILAGVVIFAVGNLTDNASNNACKTEGDTVATAVQAYRAQHDGALPVVGAGETIVSVLNGEDLLNSGTAKFMNGASGWTYNAGTGHVSTAACA